MCTKNYNSWDKVWDKTGVFVISGHFLAFYGLEIRASVRFYGPEKATQWFKTRLIRIEEQLKENVNYYLK